MILCCSWVEGEGRGGKGREEKGRGGGRVKLPRQAERDGDGGLAGRAASAL